MSDQISLPEPTNSPNSTTNSPMSRIGDQDFTDSQILSYLGMLATQFPSISKVTSEIVNLSAILALPAPTEQFISDLHGVLDAVDHDIRNGSGSIRRTIEECFRFTLSERERDELATIIYYPRDKVMQLLQLRDQRRRAAEMLEANVSVTPNGSHTDGRRGIDAASVCMIAAAEQLDDEAFFQLLLYRLVVVARVYAERYTRSRVSKMLRRHAPDWAYIMTELFAQLENQEAKRGYLESILRSIIDTGCASRFIIAISQIIRVLAIDHLFIVGDIFDRGPDAHLLLERLMAHHHITVEFGNHDVLWLGAACGSDACIANVLRISLRYGLFETLEHFGINLMPLLRFARQVYAGDPCKEFMVRGSKAKTLSEREAKDAALMHKAITIIQFKLEHQVIERHPCWGMARRNLLHRIRGLEEQREVAAALDPELIPAQRIAALPPLSVTIPIEDVGEPEFQMLDNFFPTVDPENPYELTAEEREITRKLRHLFIESRPLQTGAHWIYEHGAMFHEHNDLILIHGGIPVDEEGTFLAVQLYDDAEDTMPACPLGNQEEAVTPSGSRSPTSNIQVAFSGKELFMEIDKCVRDAFYLREGDGAFVNSDDSYSATSLSIRRQCGDRGLGSINSLTQIARLGQPSRDELHSRQVFGRDLAWWLWCGPLSPLFGRDRMATFENYFITDASARKERATPYYRLREDRKHMERIISQWGRDPANTRIVSGHTPVKMVSGENPLKAGGLCVVIDGGFVTPTVTGVAGFTLISDANALTLSGHRPFPGRKQAIDQNEDLCSDVHVLDRYAKPRRVRDTDVGRGLLARMDQLNALLSAYKVGLIKQKQ